MNAISLNSHSIIVRTLSKKSQLFFALSCLSSQFIIGHWGFIGFYERQQGGSCFLQGGNCSKSLTNVLTKITLFLQCLLQLFPRGNK